MLSRDRLTRTLLGLAGSSIALFVLWHAVLLPIGWPSLSLVGHYLAESAMSGETFKAMLMTAFRSVVSVVLGFSFALVMGLFTGRTRLGWIAFFFLLMFLQKVPAIAMVHVLVKSKLGIGFITTVVLASTVVLTFTWQVLHHRAATLDLREVFTLRLLGFKGWRLVWHGLLPHLGSALGGAARLAVGIALVLVILGEWQGVWSDGTIWQYGLGIQISRAYDAIDSEARVLAYCVWLGVLGIMLDLGVQVVLRGARRVLGVDFKR